MQARLDCAADIRELVAAVNEHVVVVVEEAADRALERESLTDVSSVQESVAQKDSVLASGQKCAGFDFIQVRGVKNDPHVLYAKGRKGFHSGFHKGRNRNGQKETNDCDYDHDFD